MGHYCKICHRTKSNESFSGKGHRDHVCKACSRLPKDERQKVMDYEFVYNVFHQQKNISKGNVSRLTELSAKYEGQLSEIAAAVAEVGKFHPLRKKRIGHLYSRRKDLFQKLVCLGLIEDYITPTIQDEELCEKMMAESNEKTDGNGSDEGGHSISDSKVAYEDDELPF